MVLEKSRGHKRIQKDTNGYKWIQKDTKGYKRIQKDRKGQKRTEAFTTYRFENRIRICKNIPSAIFKYLLRQRL